LPGASFTISCPRTPAPRLSGPLHFLFCFTPHFMHYGVCDSRLAIVFPLCPSQLFLPPRESRSFGYLVIPALFPFYRTEYFPLDITLGPPPFTQCSLWEPRIRLSVACSVTSRPPHPLPSPLQFSPFWQSSRDVISVSLGSAPICEELPPKPPAGLVKVS